MTLSLLQSMSSVVRPVTRYSVGTYLNGTYASGATTTLFVDCCVQPTSGEDKVSLPEGVRERESYKIYSQVELKTNDEISGIRADRVNLDGKIFEVQTAQNHFGLGISHWKSIVIRVNP
jgi:hypothetical protein